MKVLNDRVIGPPAAASRARRGTGTAAFAGLVAASGPQASERAAPSRPLIAPMALPPIEAVDPEAQKRKQGLARGHDILDRLDEIRLGLLTGGIPKAALERLVAQVARSRASVPDPALVGLLDEVDLRAKVELAKYERDS